ncbi:hypothetical protein C6P45_005106 [Maudiozyma exigua]|uniref:Uncharacterized protein n=1 Tax=Maudiozyma exigua TaxID=34358 RepID=A0A9P6WBP8_MAUEX|nr:hypothetical protein C6P45_005106 [Kazachstania exigua]
MSRLINRMENGENRDISSLKKSFIRPSLETGGRTSSNKSRLNVPEIELNNNSIREPTSSNRTRIAATSSNYMPDRERRHVHHRRTRVGNPDYTSATTGTFSDCMFDISESRSPLNNNSNIAVRMNKDNNDSGSNGSTNGSRPSTGMTSTGTPTPEGDIMSNRDINVSDISLGNYVFRHHPAAEAEMRSSALANGRLGSHLNKKMHRHRRSHRDEDPRSASFNSDKKRLVNEFLESMAPPTASTTKMSNILFPTNNSTSTTNTAGKLNMESISPVYSNDSDKSLQSLLYHDLEPSQTRESNNSPSPRRLSPISKLSSETSGTDSSDDSDTSSFSSVSSLQSLTNRNISAQNTSSLMLDYNDSDYYEQHIAFSLNKIETTMKVNLRESALKRENDFQKSLKDFDSIHSELETLRDRVLRFKDIVSNKYFIELNRDFEESDPKSYQSKLKISVAASVAELETLEVRMNDCKSKLDQQKDVMKRMDSLLFLENSLISSRESMSIFSKYKYIIYDFVTAVVVVILAIVINKQLKKPELLVHPSIPTNSTL